ncbi:MAG: hypothetical protein JJ974_05360 [Phycisphaerales bacterium]|nr:hypothetical protein [Phycisphaerales bacterium]
MIQPSYRRCGVMIFGTILMLSVPGCDREEIHSYRIPRERSFEEAALERGLRQATQAVRDAQVEWIAPETWTRQEASGSMRIATYQSENGIEIAVTAFPGDVGGLLANINRWRGQIGLPPTDEEGMIDDIQITDSKRVIVVDIPAEDTRLIGTLINVGDGKTWFAKAIGATAELELIKADIVQFSESFHIVEDGHDHSDHAGHDHADHEGHDHAAHGSQDQGGSSGWRIPKEWTPDQTLASMMLAGFTTESGARITLTALSGDGGGVLSNVNRWRGQVDLEQVDSIDDQPIKVLEDGSVVVDLLSTDKERRIVAGIMPIEGQTLFFKMTGTQEQTDPEMIRFEEFINAVAAERPGG